MSAYARCGTKRGAHRAAGVSRQAVDYWLRNDPTFAKYWDLARQESAELMVEEARRRAIDGVAEPVYHEGQVVGTKQKYSDTLLIFLLKGAMPETYRERVDHRHSGEVRNPAVDAALEKLLASPEALAQAEALLDGVEEAVELELGSDGVYAPADG